MELQTVRFIVWSASFGAGPARFLTCLEIVFPFNIFQAGGQKKRDVHVPPFIRRHFFPAPLRLGRECRQQRKNAACLEWPHTLGERLYGYCEIGRLRMRPYTLGGKAFKAGLAAFIGVSPRLWGKGEERGKPRSCR